MVRQLGSAELTNLATLTVQVPFCMVAREKSVSVLSVVVSSLIVPIEGEILTTVVNGSSGQAQENRSFQRNDRKPLFSWSVDERT